MWHRRYSPFIFAICIRNNPLATTVILAPVMSLSLLTVSGIVEGFGNLFASSFFGSFRSGVAILATISVGYVYA